MAGWVALSIVLIASSVLMYLLTKGLIRLQVSREIQNLAMYLVPSVIFLFQAVSSGKQIFGLSSLDFSVNLFVAIAISYFANRLSLTAIKNAPNPGYSLIIQKSYAVFTAIASVFLFSSPFTLLDALGISAIVGFSSLVVLDKGNKRNGSGKSKRNWLALSFACFFAWGLLALVSTWLLRRGNDANVLLFWRMGAVALAIIAEIAIKALRKGKSPFAFSGGNFSFSSAILFFGVGIFAWSFNASMNAGYLVAPNPGYISAANASSIAILTVASSVVFKDDLNSRKLAGVVGVVFGLVLLFI